MMRNLSCHGHDEGTDRCKRDHQIDIHALHMPSCKRRACVKTPITHTPFVVVLLKELIIGSLSDNEITRAAIARQKRYEEARQQNRG